MFVEVTIEVAEASMREREHTCIHTRFTYFQLVARVTRSLQRVIQDTLVVHMPFVMTRGSIPHLFISIMHIYNYKWRNDILQQCWPPNWPFRYRDTLVKWAWINARAHNVMTKQFMNDHKWKCDCATLREIKPKHSRRPRRRIVPLIDGLLTFRLLH